MAKNEAGSREPDLLTFDARINHLNTHIEGSQYLDLQYLTYEKDRQRMLKKELEWVEARQSIVN